MTSTSHDYVSINGHVIRQNATNGTNHPPIRVANGKNDRTPRYAREVKIHGSSRLIYDPKKKILNCGGRLAIEAGGGCVEIVR